MAFVLRLKHMRAMAKGSFRFESVLDFILVTLLVSNWAGRGPWLGKESEPWPPSHQRRLSGGYFWLTASLAAGAWGIGATLGATGMGGGAGMLGGVRCNGEALPRFWNAGRWRTVCSLPGAGAM
jgi:hypothetical protein